MDKYLMKSTLSKSKTPLIDDLLESFIKFGEQNSSPSNFKNFVDEKRGLNVDLDSKFLNSNLSRKLLQFCEQNFVYNSGRDAQIKIFNRLIDIPRKQTAFGDEGLTYKFSGTIVPAKMWTQEIRELKNLVSKAAGCQFNFVLVNRYADGNDYMGAHRDNEPDLDPEAPIASLTVGHARDFILRYSKKQDTNDNQVVKLTLENGSLLIMKPPTNNFWYHSIPKRKKITSTTGPRINFTFRKILIKTQNPIIL